MRYLIMMNLPPATNDYAYPQWAPDDWKAHRAAHRSLNKELQARGELVGIEALT